MKFSLPVLLGAAAMFVAPHAQAIVNIDYVAVGNPGNAADQDYSGQGAFGAVSQAFAIGTYEVTLTQYTEFLNAKAAADPNALWNASMQTDLNIAGIARAGSSGSFSYSVMGNGQRPVTYVSFLDAMRFANWLGNGQGSGSTETGAYTLSLGGLAPRNPGATVWIPSENEWYKAAYHQPAAQGGDSDNYWLYPMRTNAVPFSDQPPGATPDNTRVGNFYQDDSVANGYDDGYAVSGSTTLSSTQDYLTNVGAYASSASFYGTFDQGGTSSSGTTPSTVRRGACGAARGATARSTCERRSATTPIRRSSASILVFVSRPSLSQPWPSV